MAGTAGCGVLLPRLGWVLPRTGRAAASKTPVMGDPPLLQPGVAVSRGQIAIYVARALKRQ